MSKGNITVTAFNEMHVWVAVKPERLFAWGLEKRVEIQERKSCSEFTNFHLKTQTLTKQASLPGCESCFTSPRANLSCFWVCPMQQPTSELVTIHSPYTQWAHKTMLRVWCIWPTWNTLWWDEWCLRKTCFSSLTNRNFSSAESTGNWILEMFKSRRTLARPPLLSGRKMTVLEMSKSNP